MATATSIIDDTILLKGSTLDNELRGFMRNVWTTKKYSDFTLTARGHCFKVHKVFLSAHATYFSHGPGDLNQNSGLVDLEPEVLELVLKFLYEGQIEVVKGVIPKLQDAADILGVDALKKQCRFYSLCAAELTPDNCLEVWDAAVSISKEVISQKAFQMVLKNFDTSQHSPQFTELTPPRILELLPHPQLKVHNADERLGAAVNWVMYDINARIQLLPIILNLLPLQAMSVWYLRQLMHSPIVRDSGGACAQIRAALDGSKGKTLPKAGQILTMPRAKPHLRMQADINLAYNNCFVTVGVMEVKDGQRRNKVWSVSLQDEDDDMRVTLQGYLQDPHVPEGARMCSNGSDLYIGGLGESMTEIWHYNLQTQTQSLAGW